ncbi:bark storage protein A-like [Rosa rugosa]|uniref:bark storage protein A-like n=1 Tax=Rosa rugosa TaxID=74645 RepID=UPI002B415E34|nr:bark storage protein A-like [Rosa rugosa]
MRVAWPCLVVYAMSIVVVQAALLVETLKLIEETNDRGPYLGLVIPNSFEMNPLLQSPDFISANLTIDFSGRRFRFGTISEKKVVLVMTGLSMINAGITTQLLLSLFDIEGVVHCGIAGNANPDLHLADVVIPQYWAHTALWNWQRYGNGPENELPLESRGDYTREIGYLKLANYTINVTDSSDNLLSNIWYQPEEVFPVNGTPEHREHAFWVPVDPFYYEISQKLEEMKLEGCLNSTTCLSHIPKVARVQRGTSASIYLDNAAYRDLIYNKFNITPVDMESASVALICLQQKVPFIVIRALSDLAGGGSANSNEADTFIALASNNSVTVLLEFVKHLSAVTVSRTEQHLARCCGDEL